MHCAVHEIMGSRNQTGKKGVNLAKKGVKIEFSYVVLLCIEFVILLIEEKVMSYVTVSEGQRYPLVSLITRHSCKVI